MPTKPSAEQFQKDFASLREEIAKVIVGSEDIIDGVLTCMFADGHCLLEGVPGLGKTMLVRTLSEVLTLSFSRIQFTPDLMPFDIVGVSGTGDDTAGHADAGFRPGPIFANIVLADEINRATPKTQSALLEAMQEHTVTVGRQTRPLDEPFFVMATQNPIDMEGTYPLPEAQMDRFFFKLIVEYPTREEMVEILNRTTQKEAPRTSKVLDGTTILKWRDFVRDVAVTPEVADYAVRIVLGTQPRSQYATGMVNDYVTFGSSPRGAQALLLAAKVNALRNGNSDVRYQDIRQTALPALRHRVLLNHEATVDRIISDQVIQDVIDNVSEIVR